MNTFMFRIYICSTGSMELNEILAVCHCELSPDLFTYYWYLKVPCMTEICNTAQSVTQLIRVQHVIVTALKTFVVHNKHGK